LEATAHHRRCAADEDQGQDEPIVIAELGYDYDRGDRTARSSREERGHPEESERAWRRSRPNVRDTLADQPADQGADGEHGREEPARDTRRPAGRGCNKS